VPELPEVEAHAERLSERFRGAVLDRFVPLNFTALKTATPSPDLAIGTPLLGVGRRGKYLLLSFGPVVFVVHLMQGGRLVVDEALSAKPRHGQARFVFTEGPALLLTEAGKERRAGVWCVAPEALDGPPLHRLGPDALDITVEALAASFAAHNMRLHTFLRDQHLIAGLGRMLANEVCHRAQLSPFAMTGKLGADGAAQVRDAVHGCIAEALAHERARTDMGSSADRPGAVHHRVGQPCTTCSDTIRSVTYSGYTVAYCPTCQTGGKVLADNTTSKFVK
jgi:formamidopyrimidine-DNA glycosylase